jgi:hypothetical protein
MTGFRITRSSATVMEMVMVVACRTTPSSSEPGPLKASTTKAGIGSAPHPRIVNGFRLPTAAAKSQRPCPTEHSHRHANHNEVKR